MNGPRAMANHRSPSDDAQRWPLLGSAALVLAGSALCWSAIAGVILVCLRLTGRV